MLIVFRKEQKVLPFRKQKEIINQFDLRHLFIEFVKNHISFFSCLEFNSYFLCSFSIRLKIYINNNDSCSEGKALAQLVVKKCKSKSDINSISKSEIIKISSKHVYLLCRAWDSKFVDLKSKLISETKMLNMEPRIR